MLEALRRRGRIARTEPRVVLPRRGECHDVAPSVEHVTGALAIEHSDRTVVRWPAMTDRGWFAGVDEVDYCDRLHAARRAAGEREHPTAR